MKRVLFKSEFKAKLSLVLFCVTMRCKVAFPSFQIFEEEKAEGGRLGSGLWGQEGGKERRGDGDLR